MGDISDIPPDIDASVPHSARIWNYWLGGKDNYASDRAIGDQIMRFFPEIVENARGNRHFLCRAIRYLTQDAGIRQFLDIGTGLPTVDNTHEVAQRIAPECRVVYVDNDPLVLVHAQALLTSTPEGACAYLDADVRDPDSVLRRAAETLDFSRPVGLIMLGVMQFVEDTDEAYAIVRRLVDALAPGSHLALSHPTNAVRGPRMDEAVRQWNEGGGSPRLTLRSPEQVERFFEGLELLEPGVGPTTLWRPELTGLEEVRPIDDFGGVAIKR
ncbi:SAM-dependent methyltransferase [Thermostaphylospora chromogena]|uniref:O-Methyltransferase involved in polyketide biosynthesis n=1 Tax=Thermostaphylospora chromogena TaxID=35622 RepID=A0A1H1GU71_9ACTN|nr:SAM-dependent methyltransferase [Thermostaphylospora chromogena]SDR16406.1 O-Methyltransferase involved in polyketide biosynthesis [Thermostaphylospora chromogena]